jgi:hypothetical protein
MKIVRPLLYLAAWVSAALAAPGAENSPAASIATANAAFTGEFTGEWRAQNQSGGALRLKFIPGSAAALSAHVSFTFEGTVVPTTTKSLKIDGTRIQLVIGWEVDGTAASSQLIGELKNEQLEGTYDSTTNEGAAKGTWKATRTAAKS